MSTTARPMRLLGAVSAVSMMVAGCAQMPYGPSVQVMPGRGKTFAAFNLDQESCKQFAGEQVRGQAEAVNQRAMGAAVLGTVIGAGLGAATGNLYGAAGRGAGFGAAGGLATGATIGAEGSSVEQMGIQQRYDTAFSQCMFSKGDQVPGYAPMVADTPSSYRGAEASPLVRSTQAELNRLHYMNGSADGVMGSHTANAIRAYQHANGLAANGAPSPSLLARLQSTPSGSGGGVSTAAAAPAGSGWVAPGQDSTARISPVSAQAPASGWVAPTTK